MRITHSVQPALGPILAHQSLTVGYVCLKQIRKHRTSKENKQMDNYKTYLLVNCVGCWCNSGWPVSLLWDCDDWTGSLIQVTGSLEAQGTSRRSYHHVHGTKYLASQHVSKPGAFTFKTIIPIAQFSKRSSKCNRIAESLYSNNQTFEINSQNFARSSLGLQVTHNLV